MEEQLELRSLQSANEVFVAYAHGSQTVPRHTLSRSPVLSQVLHALDAQGPQELSHRLRQLDYLQLGWGTTAQIQI